MTHPGARVAAFVALLAAIFAGAVLAGGALDPDDGDRAAAGDAHAGGHALAQDSTQAADHDAARHAEPRASAGAADGTPAGVSSTQGGYRLVSGASRFAAGRAAPLTFRIVDARGATVRDFETEQARRMHVIVVRRDLRRYQHLHPTQGAGGAWTTPLTLPEAGVYRAFADFRIDGARHTLGTDLFVPGDFAPLDLPAPSRTAHVDGYDVELRERPGGELRFLVRRDGKPVADLQPYLGARGHLVALRAGDLAYQHVHPDAATPPRIAFRVRATEAGTYRLFMQFSREDRVHTAAFTRMVP